MPRRRPLYEVLDDAPSGDRDGSMMTPMSSAPSPGIRSPLLPDAPIPCAQTVLPLRDRYRAQPAPVPRRPLRSDRHRTTFV